MGNTGVDTILTSLGAAAQLRGLDFGAQVEEDFEVESVGRGRRHEGVAGGGELGELGAAEGVVAADAGRGGGGA